MTPEIKKALDLALEALETLMSGSGFAPAENIEKARKAITAVKKAQTQTVQEPVATVKAKRDGGGTFVHWTQLPVAGMQLYTAAQPTPANLWLYWKVDDKSVITGPFKTHSKVEAYGLGCIDQTPLTVPAAQVLAVQEPVIQRVMSRLADLLDEDQFKEIEGMVVVAGCKPPTQPAPVPEGMVLLPKRMTQAMRDVTDTEDWRWEDLLAAAEATTEDEYNELAAAPAAPTMQEPVAWAKQILDAFPLFDDDGLNEEEHHCEWALQQDRKRLHAMLTTLPAQPAQEPVAVARVDDLERGGRVRALAMGLALDAALYTAPPAPVPLTADQREEIAKGWRGRNWSVGDIIDAIEAAHKITTTPKKGNT